MSSTTNQPNTRKAILTRTMVVFSGMCLLGLAILVGMFTIQVVEGDKWEKKREAFSLREVDVTPVRGNIFDCNGNLLATSVPTYELRIDSKAHLLNEKVNKDVKYDLDTLCRQLAKEVPGRTADQYRVLFDNLIKSGNRNYPFLSNVPYRKMKLISKMKIFEKGRYQGGLMITEQSRRERPFGILAARTIGFSHVERSDRNQKRAPKIFRVGLEGSFDSILRGTVGRQVQQRIAGKAWVPVDAETTLDAEQGNDIQTTLDIHLQDVAENSLRKVLEESGAGWGTAVLMEVKTGAVKAIANLKKNDSTGAYDEAENYAIRYAVEPGSTMKLLSMMALLEDGFVLPDDHVDLEGGETLLCGQRVIDSHKDEKIGLVTMQYAFEHSSNVAFAKKTNQYYQKNPEKFYAWFEKLGLTKALETDIKGAGKPLVKHPDAANWRCSTVPWMSFGYEMTLTPLQVLTLYNTVANKGTLVKPYFVSSISNGGRLIKKFEPTVLQEKVCSDSTLLRLRRMMEGVVLRGTARFLYSPNYLYAGKTGTAVISNGKSGYGKDGLRRYRASFCGYFPANNPLYSCIVVVNDLKGTNAYGATIALPVFKDIADKVYASSLNLHKDLKQLKKHYSPDMPLVSKASTDDLKLMLDQLGLPWKLNEELFQEEDALWASAQATSKGIEIQPKLHAGGIIPDVRGMGLKDALYLLESKGMKVVVQGVGKVQYQWPEPGAQSQRSKLVTIQLGT
ncbi:MAG: penicillin-binding protein 2 [Bacteroidia bacterium]|nr:penicillin-binding protein 2 [Bacteroidia bacterium]